MGPIWHLLVGTLAPPSSTTPYMHRPLLVRHAVMPNGCLSKSHGVPKYRVPPVYKPGYLTVSRVLDGLEAIRAVRLRSTRAVHLSLYGLNDGYFTRSSSRIVIVGIDARVRCQVPRNDASMTQELRLPVPGPRDPVLPCFRGIWTLYYPVLEVLEATGP